MIKLIKDERVRSYELTILVSSELSEGDLSSLKEGIEKDIAKHQGKLTETQDWGEKNLAYAIKKQRKAKFFHFVFTMPTLQAQALEKEIYLMPVVMRHLLIANQ